MGVENLEPKECFRWFAELAGIPRGSYRERQAGDFLESFALARGLAARRDAAGNVLIRKPAYRGMENAPTVILQGHLDMVCVKEEGLEFDFEKDPLKLAAEGDRIFAEGTTLGADNGIALAFMLAALDDAALPHPPLEAVFTVQEEVGMGGAAAFDAAQTSGVRFINIDSEREGVFCSSCAGGRRSRLVIPAPGRDVGSIEGREGFVFRRITLGGLQGGHSGLEILKQRGNSNQLLCRALDGLSEKFEFHLAALAGGTAANVIPKESSAVVFIKAGDDELRRELERWEAIFRREFMDADGAALSLGLKAAEGAGRVLTPDALRKVLLAALLMPDGVFSMSLADAGEPLAESSSNFAVISMEEGAVVFQSQSRSSVPGKKEYIWRRIRSIGELVGGRAEYSGDYPAWEFNPGSGLREVFKQAYRDLFRQEARVEGVHAGLECALFAQKFKELGREVDFIAFGPDITGAHSVHESLSRASTERSWKLLKEVLRRLGADSK